MKTIAAAGSIAFLTGILLSGCATQADLQAQNRENDQLRTQLADSRAANETVRREVEKVRGEMEELRYRLDRATKARPATAVSPAQIQSLEERVVTLERQLTMQRDALNTSRTTPTIPSPPPMVTPPPPPPVETPPVAAVPPQPPAPPPVLSLPIEDEILLAKEPPEVQEDYRGAWQALNGQQYDKAIQQFRTFQRKNPSS